MTIIQLARTFTPGTRVSWTTRQGKVLTGTVAGEGCFAGTVMVRPDKLSKLAVMLPSIAANELRRESQGEHK